MKTIANKTIKSGKYSCPTKGKQVKALVVEHSLKFKVSSLKMEYCDNEDSFEHFKEQNSSNSFVRFYSEQQIMKLRQYTRPVETSLKREHRMSWMKFKNFLLGITEKDLVAIERIEWSDSSIQESPTHNRRITNQMEQTKKLDVKL